MEYAPRGISVCGRPLATQSGLTLIELLMGVVVLAIILAIGVPSFRSTIAANRLTTSVNDVVGSIALARSEAVRRGARVTVCKSANGTACTTSGTWQQGWIVFIDTTRATFDPAVDAGESIVAVAGARPENVTVQGTAAVANYVSFAADGTVRTMTGAPLTGRLLICSTASYLTDARRARELSISSAGRLASTTVSVSSACAAPT